MKSGFRFVTPTEDSPTHDPSRSPLRGRFPQLSLFSPSRPQSQTEGTVAALFETRDRKYAEYSRIFSPPNVGDDAVGFNVELECHSDVDISTSTSI